ncbi:hypothetical protein ACIBBE_47000 [Streptomyces sp. NPDC051644]|uniref:hypothetical protein n=1 Tax=Streptomyces sp. NPDC051644 TaxID=3365666 RepID=UPI0037B469E4
METRIPVMEIDDDYTSPADPHMAWSRRRFASAVPASTAMYVEPGALVYLRDGGRTVATAELAGSYSYLVENTDDEADTIAAWLPTLRHLAGVIRLERMADTMEYHLAQLQGHWEAAEGGYVTGLTTDEVDEERDTAYSYEKLLRDVVPHDDQVAMRLPEATAAHAARLRDQATALRAAAVADMPDPRTGAHPGLRWVGPYSRQQQEKIRSRSEDTWYADLPLQLLRGYKASAGAPWDGPGETAGRDALVQWAVQWGLPKTAISTATGIARTTIDRLLSI